MCAAPRSDLRRRAVAFATVAALCAAGTAGYAWWSAQRAKAAALASPQRKLHLLESLIAQRGAYALFRSTALGDSYGYLSLERLDDADGTRSVSRLQCERIHFAAGRGICLQAERGAVTVYSASLFDRSLAVTHTWTIAGPPSRARLSPDGRYAATTVFIAGHGYASTTFSTRTSIVDATSGEMLVDDLEKFAVVKDGAALHGTTFNFWGVTFARDPNRFYATLGDGRARYLVEGDLAARTLRVVHDNVECPSLSPDGKHIAFKRRFDAEDGRAVWRIVVLDLAGRRETLLANETRNVDDQIEWLSDEEVTYALPDDASAATAATNVWALSANGSRPPRLLLPLAYSPAVVAEGR